MRIESALGSGHAGESRVSRPVQVCRVGGGRAGGYKGGRPPLKSLPFKVYLAHATSFCGSVWRPVVSSLGELESVVWDFAGHGAGPDIDLPVDWSVFGGQVLDETKPGGVGVGHSMGGAALVMAQLADPSRFRALVLIEPIIFPGPHRRLDHPLSAIALKRKHSFDSREEAVANFSSREAFSNWHPSALEGYVECGLVGDGPVHLACTPEVEADIYRASNAHDTFERLHEVTIPVLIMAGDRSDTVTPDLVRAQTERLPLGGFEIVEETGHFLPMERPDLISERVGRLARFSSDA
ncbi:MAG: alpha/beta hydrolase [Acidimicrobiia bacterium]